jgi:histidinol-phosphatase (PHP family)
MIPLDYHIHSTFSPDSLVTPEEICRRAIELGIPEIGLSEHWDVSPYEQDVRYLKAKPWYAELERLRGLFAGQLVIRAGIEISEPHLYPEDTAWILSQVPFDYVLGSVHYVGEQLMYDESYFRQHPADEVYEAYFAELGQMAEKSNIDIIAHFDIPARTAKPIFGYDPTRYETTIRAVLGTAIERGLALDINVAGLRKPAHNLMPDPIILRWYHQMGGKRLTFGSDTHSLDHLGINFEIAMQALQEAGLEFVTQFERRQAWPVPLDR